MISRVPLPARRSGVAGLAIAGNPDGHLSPWQEAVEHEIIPATHKNGCASEVTTDLTLGLLVPPPNWRVPANQWHDMPFGVRPISRAREWS
jgi:hypothetical protein